MKKKIIGIIITLFALSFVSMSHYKVILAKLEAINIHVKIQSKDDDSETGYDIGTEDSTQNLDVSDATEMKNLKLYALSAALMDADNGRVLYEKDGYTQMAMASTTKIMTCIITLENANLEDIVTVSKYASTMPDVQLTIREGEQYILKDLLFSLMLESHNDVAVAIAEHVGGSVEGFASMMNTKAKELGCEHTNFVTPNGLDADEHYTTAVELAKIASYAIKNKEFIQITNTLSWQFSDIKGNRSFSVNNKDRFLSLYAGAIGIKTGFTNRAGYCFVGAVDKDDKTFVSVVLGCGWPPNKSYKWHDTTSLMNFGMDNFELRQIFNAEKAFDPVFVEDGQENFVDLYYEGDISLLMNKNEVVKVVYKVPKAIMAPVVAETIVGSAKYYVGKDLIQEVPILTASSVVKIDYEFCIRRILNIWLILKQQ